VPTVNASDVIEKAKGSARGRKDRSGQEAVIKLAPVKERVDEMVQLYEVYKDSGAQLNEGIKALAEASGLMASVVRKFIVARAGDNFDEKKREADQLSLVFDEVGNG
jgi:hypothetical protein